MSKQEQGEQMGKKYPDTWSALNDLIDVCFEHTNCPDCLIMWEQVKDFKGHKRNCRVNRAILHMRDLAEARV